jgi:hypothetical protein
MGDSYFFVLSDIEEKLMQWRWDECFPRPRAAAAEDEFVGAGELQEGWADMILAEEHHHEMTCRRPVFFFDFVQATVFQCHKGGGEVDTNDLINLMQGYLLDGPGECMHACMYVHVMYV